MARIISDIAQEAINASNTAEVFLTLIEISHPSLVTPLRFVNNTVDIIRNGNTYTAVAFDFTPPVDEEGTIQNASVAIDGVDRSIVEVIRDLTTPPTLTTYIILASDPDNEEAGPWEFVLRNVNYNVTSISGDLVYQNYIQEYASIYKYNNINFPALYISNGRDFNGCDCYGLVRLILKNEFNKELPLLLNEYANSGDISITSKVMDKYLPILSGKQIDTPSVGDVCVFRYKGSPCHLGLYIGNNKVLHILRKTGFSVCERLNSPFLKGRLEGFYEVN